MVLDAAMSTLDRYFTPAKGSDEEHAPQAAWLSYNNTLSCNSLSTTVPICAATCFFGVATALRAFAVTSLQQNLPKTKRPR